MSPGMEPPFDSRDAATEVETLLMALYTATWSLRPMADWAATYITERRGRSRIEYGRLAVVELPDGRFAIVDTDAKGGAR